MRKPEFIKAIAEYSGYSQKDIRIILNAMEDVAYKLVPENDVPIMSGLTLTTVVKKEHMARNPKTQEEILIPERKCPKVKIGRRYKEAVLDK